MDLLTRGAGFGYIGSTITSLIYASFTFIFFALEAAIMAYALELAFGIPPAWGYLICALVVIPLVTHGSAPPLDHRWECRLRGVERGCQVRADDVVPVCGLDVEERSDERAPGVVDQPIDPTEPLDDPIDQRRRLGPVGKIGRERLRSWPFVAVTARNGRRGVRLAYALDRPLGRAGVRPVVDRDDRALPGRLDRDLRTDATAAPGDEDDLVLE
jgi:hypothetical protein